MEISQREAQRLRKRVEALEAQITGQRSRYVSAWPGGTHIGTIPLERSFLSGRVEAARMLGHAVVITSPNNDGKLELYALPLPEQEL